MNKSNGQQPAAPTSGSWRGDAETLLEMGAKQIGAVTVRGLLDETRLDWSRPDLEAHRVKAENSTSCTIHGHKIRVVNSADLNAIEDAMEAVRAEGRASAPLTELIECALAFLVTLPESAKQTKEYEVLARALNAHAKFESLPERRDEPMRPLTGAELAEKHGFEPHGRDVPNWVRAMATVTEERKDEPPAERARLDADGTAKPKTEIVAVMPESAANTLGMVHVGQATHYVVRPTKQTSERAVRFAKAQSRVVDQYSDTFAKLAEEECTGVIPNTFIACGEGGNYCSEGCEEKKETSRVDEILEVITTRSTPLTRADIDRICLTARNKAIEECASFLETADVRPGTPTQWAAHLRLLASPQVSSVSDPGIEAWKSALERENRVREHRYRSQGRERAAPGCTCPPNGSAVVPETEYLALRKVAEAAEVARLNAYPDPSGDEVTIPFEIYKALCDALAELSTGGES